MNNVDAVVAMWAGAGAADAGAAGESAADAGAAGAAAANTHAASESAAEARAAGAAAVDAHAADGSVVDGRAAGAVAVDAGSPSHRAGSGPSGLRFVRAGRVPYEVAWAEQRRLHAARLAGEAPDTVLLLEHPSVYTAGRRTEPWERPIDGTPVIDVDRGGKITWHGPGQLVGYPIVALPRPIDVVAYVRRLEAALIAVCAEVGVRATRVEGRSGVWVPADKRGPDRKVAAIGIRVRRGVTMHGFALNCDCDLTAFSRIVPCGITDAGVTSLTTELGRRVGVADAVEVVESVLGRDGLATPAAERRPLVDVR